MNRVLFALTLTSSLLLSADGRALLLADLSAWLSPLRSQPVGKEGCGADPNGRCAPAPLPAPSTDAGCGADPNGCSWGS